MSNAYGWEPTHDANGRTPEGAAFEAQVDALKRRVFPAAVREDAVRKALRGLPGAVPAFNRAGEFLGAVSAQRLLATGATVERLAAVRKAKGQPPLVAVFDAAGNLAGVVAPGDLITLGKGEQYVHDATGNVIGIMGTDKKVRPIATAAATPVAKPPPPTLAGVVMDGADRAAAAEPAPVAKARRRSGSSSEAMLRQLAHGRSAATLVRKQLAPADELLTGAIVYANLAPDKRRAWEACLAGIPAADREATASKVRTQLGTSPGTERLLWALGRVNQRAVRHALGREQASPVRSNSPPPRR